MSTYVMTNEQTINVIAMPAFDLRLFRLSLLSARLPNRRSLTSALRIAMGAGLGALFGAASGHELVWLGIGLSVGLLFARALARDAATR